MAFADGTNRPNRVLRSSRENWLRDGFEGPQPSWEREYTDTTVNLIAQERSQRAAHGGKQSERFQFEAGSGSRFFVSFAVPKVPVNDDLGVGVWVRSNRAGVQVFGRVVLPTDIDPETKAPSFLLIAARSSLESIVGKSWNFSR